MFNWTKLTKLVLQAEFPDFELFAKFSVFRVVDSSDEGSTHDIKLEDSEINCWVESIECRRRHVSSAKHGTSQKEAALEVLGHKLELDTETLKDGS